MNTIYSLYTDMHGELVLYNNNLGDLYSYVMVTSQEEEQVITYRGLAMDVGL